MIKYKSCLSIMMLTIVVNLFPSEHIIDIFKILSLAEQNLEDTFVEESDFNGDGNSDYLVRTSTAGDKVMESIDFNFDGIMDDFYFYFNGIIIRREVDSNFDSKIDVWVYIKDGSYIEKYEHDLNFDGIIDKVKIFEGDD